MARVRTLFDNTGISFRPHMPTGSPAFVACTPDVAQQLRFPLVRYRSETRSESELLVPHGIEVCVGDRPGVPDGEVPHVA
jgi:hypothetical protein